MFAFIKALLVGMVVNFVISFTVKAEGYDGGVLNIKTLHLFETEIPWSWPLLVVSTLIAFGILLLME